jgi:IstB-like ATP binding protein
VRRPVARHRQDASGDRDLDLRLPGRIARPVRHATRWVARLSEAKRQGSLEAELRRLSFIPLIVVDEVGYIPFDPEPPTSCSA